MESIWVRILEQSPLVGFLAISVLFLARWVNAIVKSTTDRLDNLEKWVREDLKESHDKLGGIIEKNTAALQGQADASRECAHANRSLQMSLTLKERLAVEKTL